MYRNENGDKLLKAIREDIDRDREGFDPRAFRPGNPLCIGEYYKTWLSQIDADDKTKSGYKTAIVKYAIPYFGVDKDIRKFKKAELTEFKKTFSLEEKGIYNKMGALKSMIRWAYSNEEIKHVPPFPILSMGDEKPIEYLTVEQQKENVAAIPERDRPIFKFGMEYGLRVQEARAIMKDTIKNGNIEIRRRFADNKLMEGTKTPLRKKKMRVLYLTTYAREIIKEVWNNDSPFLFTRADGKPYTNKDLNKIWHAACAVTGNHIKLYNALRHSLGCQLLDEGRTEHEVADILGHESTRMTRKYARRTVKKIGQILEMRRCGSVAVVSNEAK